MKKIIYLKELKISRSFLPLNTEYPKAQKGYKASKFQKIKLIFDNIHMEILQFYLLEHKENVSKCNISKP